LLIETNEIPVPMKLFEILQSDMNKPFLIN